jgi:broad specificity phosphatase PhoE
VTLYLVRHAHAGDRYHWDGDDAERPLSRKGERQTAAIAEALAPEPITRILSSRFRRCLQTVEPLADRLAIELEVAEPLAEGASGTAALALTRELTGVEAVLCSHGDVIPELLGLLLADGMAMSGPRRCEKGSVWRIDVEDGRFAKGTYLGRPAD